MKVGYMFLGHSARAVPQLFRKGSWELVVMNTPIVSKQISLHRSETSMRLSSKIRILFVPKHNGSQSKVKYLEKLLWLSKFD